MGNDTSRGAEPCVQPALLTRTSRELLGDRALPTVLRTRVVRFVLGPEGVGKTTVGRRLLGPNPLECDAECVRKALNLAGRQGAWSAQLLEAPDLLIDGLECLHRRYGAVRLLGELLKARALAGRPTVLIQGPADTSVTLLYPELPCESRATVLLRFPVGGGRRRYVTERCRSRGIDPARAASVFVLEPWSYAGVERSLDELG